MNDEENLTNHEADEATPNESECDPVSAPVPCEDTDTGGAEEGRRSVESPCGEIEPVVRDEAISADPVQDADPSVTPDSADTAPTDATGQLEQLRNELTALRAEIAARDERLSRMSAEYAEFRTLYPSVPFDAIDDCVMEDVKHGLPLAAAYALAERRRHIAEEQAARINAENSHRTSGALRATDEDYFSAEEVRKMSQSEVRTNYQKILKSMQKWH